MNKMSKLFFLFMCIVFTSCATLTGGSRTDYQKNKPVEGEAKRQVRPAPLVLNILFFPPGIIVDFATGHAYRRAPKSKPANGRD